MADKVSLSPILYSSTATTSFSLMIGMTPMSSIVSNALREFMNLLRSWESMRVKRTWPTTWPYSRKSRSYVCMRTPWPTAARACFSRIDRGR